MSDEVAEQPVVEAAQEAAPPELNIEDDAAVDAALKEGAISVPDGEELITGSQVGKVAGAYRAQLRELKAQLKTATEGSARSQELEQRVGQYEQTLNSWKPYIDALRQQPAQQATQPVEDTSGLEDIARTLDLYTPEGKPDIARAKKVSAMMSGVARAEAQGMVAPFAEMTVKERSGQMLQRAINTELPNGLRADKAMLEQVWAQLSPAITATHSGAMEAFYSALGRSAGTIAQDSLPKRDATGKFLPKAEPKPDLPAPIYTEAAGGKEGPEVFSLNDSDRKAIKAMQITEKEYMEIAKGMPKRTR